MKPSTYARLLLSIFLLCTAGCLGASHTAPKIDFYTLEYDPPCPTGTAPLPVVLDVSRFSIVPDYNSLRIVFRDAPYERDEYTYHRWHADPADLVTSFIRRDFSRSGRFLAICGTGTGLSPTHILTGSVDDFYERDRPDTWEAVLGLTITLSRADEPDVSKRIIFQRCYRTSQSCPTRTPAGVARAMSLAMEELSGRILADVLAAIPPE
ncbi:ABC-type transport auxiliary lipoprotein family protein [Desulfoplanes sp.]